MGNVCFAICVIAIVWGGVSCAKIVVDRDVQIDKLYIEKGYVRNEWGQWKLEPKATPLKAGE